MIQKVSFRECYNIPEYKARVSNEPAVLFLMVEDDFIFINVLSTSTTATLNEVLLIIHSEWFFVYWIFICSRVISLHINGWSCITVLLCSSRDTRVEKGLVYNTVTKLSYWRQSCILVWTQRLILLSIVAELTNPCCWIFVCWCMRTVLSSQTERCSLGEQN